MVAPRLRLAVGYSIEESIIATGGAAYTLLYTSFIEYSQAQRELGCTPSHLKSRDAANSN